MTLPTTLPISMSDIATELGISPPFSLGDAACLALAGKTALPVSMSDFLGKTYNLYGITSTVAWDDIAATVTTTASPLTTSSCTISGNPSAVTLRLSIVLSHLDNYATTITWYIFKKNSSGTVSGSSYVSCSAVSTTYTVDMIFSAGESIYFMYVPVIGSSGHYLSGTCSLTNVSDTNKLLDSFTFSISRS